MSKLVMVFIILIILLGIYWYQSKLDDKYESEKIIKDERISLTDSPTYNSIKTQESEEDNQTLKSFNIGILEEMKEDNISKLSKTDILIKNDNEEEDKDSQFTDSDLRGEPIPTMDEQLDNIE